jgi:hypothetical protein
MYAIFLPCATERGSGARGSERCAGRAEGVLSHETGHMIGLGHVDSPTSIMKQDSSMKESWFGGSIDDETKAAIDRLYSK